RSIRRTRNSGGILPLVYPAGSVSEPKPLGHQCERPPGVFAGAPLRLPNRNTPTSALDNGAIDCSSRNQLHSVSHKTIRGIEVGNFENFGFQCADAHAPKPQEAFLVQQTRPLLGTFAQIHRRDIPFGERPGIAEAIPLMARSSSMGASRIPRRSLYLAISSLAG